MTINQFFEGFKSASKDEEPDYYKSDRIKIVSNDNNNEIEMGKEMILWKSASKNT